MGMVWLIAGLVALGVVMNKAGQPEGIRNNNPLNVRATNTQWNGQVGVDVNNYVKFSTAADGIRAAAIIIRHYQQWYGLNTIRGIVERWAPPSENPTESYISYVSDKMGILPDEHLDLGNDSTLANLLAAMIGFENGKDPYAFSYVEAAVHQATV